MVTLPDVVFQGTYPVLFGVSAVLPSFAPKYTLKMYN